MSSTPNAYTKYMQSSGKYEKLKFQKLFQKLFQEKMRNVKLERKRSITFLNVDEGSLILTFT